MKVKLIAVIGLITLFLAACGGESNEDANVEELEAEEIKELVHDYSVGNITGQVASITADQLIVTDSDDSQVTYSLPDDEFFVSIAPYVNQTHP